MRAGDVFGDLGQRAVARIAVFEPFIQNEDHMGLATPFSNEPDARSQCQDGSSRTTALPGTAAQQRSLCLLAEAAMGLLLELVCQRPNEQVPAQTVGRITTMVTTPLQTKFMR
jgi:hypothetical protein